MAYQYGTPVQYSSILWFTCKQRKKTIRTPSSVMQKRKQKNSPSIKSSKSRTGSVSKKRSVSTNKTKPLISWELYSAEEYSIQIPSNWQGINDKTQLPDKLDVVFIGKGSGSLTPTINISQEITAKSQPEYIEEILTYHKSNDMTLDSSVFAHIKSPSGEFTIIKTEKNSSWGKVFCLQGVSVINHTAYIFTSTATLDDYPAVSLIFLKTVASFKLSNKETMSGDAILKEALKQFHGETN
ncbi:hypothetical protein [Chlamydia avium]|uniref:Uncharacterized protein n=1 Tax=Chlamydia avium 10DC88 TaxID=1229831 RepID=W8JM08_9CHLA|nr:Uncharacterized protein M832_04610 [Chlamydia avium 10DC88]